jgi:hypothetical protein
MTKNGKNLQLKKEFDIFLIKKKQFTYSSASIKDVQATGEALSHQKENIQHFKT